MKYDLTTQAEKQKKLDKYILDKINISKTTYWKHRVIALLVELNELSNEVRFFKYWSKKPPSSKEVILDEYVDVIHFAISLGNTLGLTNWNYDVTESDRTMDAIYFDISRKMLELVDKMDKELFESMMFNIIEYAFCMGYSMKDIENAYDIKNKINYERQNTGY